MTTIEYMERQAKKHRLNYDREKRRNAHEDELRNIRAKIAHYETAIAALKKAGDGKCA